MQAKKGLILMYKMTCVPTVLEGSLRFNRAVKCQQHPKVGRYAKTYPKLLPLKEEKESFWIFFLTTDVRLVSRKKTKINAKCSLSNNNRALNFALDDI